MQTVFVVSRNGLFPHTCSTADVVTCRSYDAVYVCVRTVCISLCYFSEFLCVFVLTNMHSSWCLRLVSFAVYFFVFKIVSL